MLEGKTMGHGSRVFVLTPGRGSQQQQREKEKELEYYIRSEKGVSYISLHTYTVQYSSQSIAHYPFYGAVTALPKLVFFFSSSSSSPHLSSFSLAAFSGC